MNERVKGVTLSRRKHGGLETAPPAPAPRFSVVVPADRSRREALSQDAPKSVSQAFVSALADLGVEHAFALFGGGIAPFCHALAESPIRLMHFRHEAGAAFAAIEASLASGRLVVVVATTGPGLSNLYTGMIAARLEGAKVLFVSGGTPAAQRGRGAFQETSNAASMNLLFSNGGLFNYAATLEDPAELEVALARLATGLSRPNGFIAHVCLPLPVQTARVQSSESPRIVTSAPAPDPGRSLAEIAELLSRETFVIWAGFGARHAGPAVRALAERTGARVMCSPRGKGVMPEGHPLFLGVTGLGGHSKVEASLSALKPQRTLVLGSRLGEFTSFWSPELLPSEGFIHVDVDPDVFGAAYPNVPTVGVQAEVSSFLEALLAHWPAPRTEDAAPLRREQPAIRPRESGLVRPSFLMAMLQREVVEKTDGIVLTEAGNSFALGTHHLRFDAPGRYRVSTAFGSMGHAATGVIGAALGSRRKAWAIVGDGAMLMLSEVSTAAAYGIDAVWVVLNDARYGMIAQGMRSIGWQPFETDFPRADFVAIARGMCGDGVQVERESEIQAALEAARAATGPFVIDVLIDPAELAPATKRNKSLVEQGVNGRGGGR
ncbi:MAG TPA: thiamine pyrophosphate-binding protein [Polyangiaceae bacterium]|nr:thiamine pyrophosphate-binding protein [Polyangiaceae bacterium]